MGVTIHFEGQVTDLSTYEVLMVRVKEFAAARIWLTELIQPAVQKLLRVRRETEEKWDYFGPVSGMIVYVHEDCDPVRLEFDENLYIQEFVKTQFAGAKIHVAVIELLRVMQPFFEQLYVNDEGEYWDSGNLEKLSTHIATCQRMIETEAKKSPKARKKVKTPEGRIIDLIQ